MKIAIGTTSELKIRALKSALDVFGIFAEVIPVKTDSGVSNQPFGYDETLNGAKNRVNSVKNSVEADLYIAVESGLMKIENNYFDIAFSYILKKNGTESIALSSGYFVPDWVISRINNEKTELGEITKKLSGNNEHDKDPLKYFSSGLMKRENVLSQSLQIALAQALNEEKYIEKE